MRSRIVFHALAVVVACAVGAAAQGAVVYVDIDDLETDRLPITLDFDGDGSTDFFVFRTDDVGVSVSGARDNTIQRDSPTSPFVRFITRGESIDEVSRYETSGFMAQVLCEPGGCAWFGPFTQSLEPGFVGVSFLVDEMTHFGWIQIGVSRLTGVATVFDFAYETDADTPIRAGQVPAPGGVALLASLGFVRRRRSSSARLSRQRSVIHPNLEP